jgi:transposase
MKTIRIQISEPERQELFLLRQKSGDYRSERALAVLHCADGKRPRQIADMLKRSSQAICQWLHAYQKDGLAGLDKDYSPGRPSVRKEKLIPHLSEYLAKSPRDFGWGEDVWSVKVLMAQFEKENGFAISRYTIIRALYDDGFTAKRAKKTTPAHAPSKEEKLQRVQEIASEIAGLRCNGDVEVMFLDESHFSTDPYVVRGWSKRGQPFFPPDSDKTRELHDIWGIRSGKRWFLLEEFC